MAGPRRRRCGEGSEGRKSDVPVDPARAFDRQPVWKRIIVILAGVTMNVVFAFFIYTGLAATAGHARAREHELDSVRGRRAAAGAKALASLKSGDRIVRVNGDTIRSWNALLDHILTGPATLRFRKSRAGPSPSSCNCPTGAIATRAGAGPGT